MKVWKADLCLAACVAIGATLYLYADSQLKLTGMSDPIGPRGFPALVGVGLIVSALLLCRESWLKRRLTSDAEESTIQEEPVSKKRQALPVLIALIAWTGFYYFCFERIGYLIATTIFLFGSLSYFHRGHYVANGVIAISVTVVLDLLFSHFLNVPMPTGILSI